MAAQRRSHLLPQHDPVPHRLRTRDRPDPVALLVRVGPVLLNELLVVPEAAGCDHHRAATNLLVPGGHPHDLAILLDQLVRARHEGHVHPPLDPLGIEHPHHRQPLALGRVAPGHRVDPRDVDPLRLVLDAQAAQPLERRRRVVAVPAGDRRLHVPLVERHVVAEHVVRCVIEDARFALHARARRVEVAAGEPRGAAHLVVRLQHDHARARVCGGYRRGQSRCSRTDDDNVVVPLHAVLPRPALPAWRIRDWLASWEPARGASSVLAGTRAATAR